MAKLSKSDLKYIVKECLVEILQEGLTESNRRARPRSVNLNESLGGTIRSSSKMSSISKPRNRRPGLDHISLGGESKKRVRNSSFESNIKNVTNSMTSDPVLSSILADTAKTTLQEQIGAERSSPTSTVSRPADKAAKIVSESSLDKIFGNASEKWAQLAFSESVIKS